MIGAVAVGFFQDVRLGVIIALAHYTVQSVLALLCVSMITKREMSSIRHEQWKYFLPSFASHAPCTYRR